MAETITMPKLGFDMAEGTLVRWVVSEGQEIKKGAVLAEIETDKATVEVESAYEGIVYRHLVKEGDVVPVGEPIAIVSAPGEQIAPTPSSAQAVTTAAVAPAAAAPATVEAPAAEAEAAPPGAFPGGVRASPVARRMAQEKGVDLRRIQGSGPGGRIVKRDVEALQERGAPVPTIEVAPAVPAPVVGAPVPVEPKAVPLAAPAVSLAAPAPLDQEIPLNRLRAAIGRRMVEAKQQIPHFYITHEYDMAGVMALRKQINALLPEEEKISVNDFLIKATALALRQFPNLNATFQGDKIIQRGQINMGVAVAVEGGLLTVVCRDADRKSLRQIAMEVRALVGRARLGKVRPEDIEGSTFSISNLGMYEVDDFIAIINPPEAAILAVGSVREVPVVVNGEVKPGLRMKATISVDHRVSDGAEAARFLQALTPYLEEPLRLLL